MPTKVWAVGEEVLAADFNTYVQKQVVAVFANAAARDAALPAPTIGMIVYVVDITEVQLATTALPTGWKAIARASGVSGTWNPVFGNTGTPDVAKTIAEAKYVVEGGLCTFWFDFTTTAASSGGASAATIALPFPAVGHSNFAVIGHGAYIVPGAPAFWSAHLSLAGAANPGKVNLTTEDGVYGVDVVRGITAADAIRGTGRYRIA